MARKSSDDAAELDRAVGGRPREVRAGGARDAARVWRLARLDPTGIRSSDDAALTTSREPRVRARVAIEVFTTRIDTIYGANFLLLAPEHPLVQEWSKEPGAERVPHATCSGSRRRTARRG